jgi:hypothetical protein
MAKPPMRALLALTGALANPKDGYRVQSMKT